MASPEPLVRFYDLSGPKPWSPACWRTRYALNYKHIPYECVKLSYPGIKPMCHKLLGPDWPDKNATVPIIEILQAPYVAINDSTPIAELLNERFKPEDGFPEIKMIEEMKQYSSECSYRGRAIFRWIVHDVWANALDPNDGSKEYFKTTREERLEIPLEDIVEERGGGDAAIFEDHKVQWLKLKERMAKEDGTGEPTYIDFYDASLVRWIEAANAEKGKRLMNLYGDDTFTKLMNKVKPYET